MSAYPPPYVERSSRPSMFSPGCFIKGVIFLIFGVFAVLILLNNRGAHSPATANGTVDSVQSPTPIETPTPIIQANLAHLQETAAALDNEQHQMNNQGTALALEAYAAQVTQQAIIFATQLAFDQAHRNMTTTVESQYAQATAAIVTATAQEIHAQAIYNDGQTATAVISQATAYPKTATAQANAETANDIRSWLSTYVWSWALPLLLFSATVALLICLFWIAKGFATSLAQRYSQPRPADVLDYLPDQQSIQDDEIPWTKVLIPSQDGRSGDYVLLHVYPDKLLQFAVGVINKGISVAERHWTGSDGLFVLSEYDLFKDSMIATACGQWKKNIPGTTQGWALTAKGWRALSAQAFPIPVPAHSPTELSVPQSH